MAVPDADSIAGVADRLALWGKRAPKGLARVEFDSDFSRQKAEARVRDACAAANIPFHAISLPQSAPAHEVVSYLMDTFAALPPGVVSLSGWATAFPPDLPLLDSLRVLNYNRENLAQYPLRQIWWMTREFTDAVIRNIPDLASWFIVRLALKENIAAPRDETSAPTIPLASPEQQDAARSRSAALHERFQNALNGEINLPDISALGNAAVKELREVGLGKEAEILSVQVLNTLVDLPAHHDYLSGTLTLRDKEQVRLLQNLVDLYNDQRMYRKAEAALEKALVLTEKMAGPESEEVAVLLNDLAFFYREENRYAEAEPLFNRSLAIIENALGSEHLKTATALANLAELYLNQARYAEVEPLLKRSLAIREKALGREHYDTALGFNNLAALYLKQSRYAETEPLLVRSLAIREKTLGREHYATAGSLNNLAEFYSFQGRFMTAEPLFKRSLAIMQKSLGHSHPHTITVMENYADLLQELGRNGEAWMMQGEVDRLKAELAKKNAAS